MGHGKVHKTADKFACCGLSSICAWNIWTLSKSAVRKVTINPHCFNQWFHPKRNRYFLCCCCWIFLIASVHYNFSFLYSVMLRLRNTFCFWLTSANPHNFRPLPFNLFPVINIVPSFVFLFVYPVSLQKRSCCWSKIVLNGIEC